MLRVKNEIFYHINSTSNENPYNLLSVGDIIRIGETTNPFMLSYEHSAPPLLRNEQALINAITFYWHYAREVTFEEVRKSINEKLPSRFKCLWVSDLRNISKWKVHFQQNNMQLLELSLTGTIFKSDASFVEGNPIPLNVLREKAKKYWSGVIESEDNIEYLFYGEAEVVRVL